MTRWSEESFQVLEINQNKEQELKYNGKKMHCLLLGNKSCVAHSERLS